MRLVKAILFILITLIVLGILAMVATMLFSGRIVRTAVETAGTRTLNVRVDADRASASLLSGAVALHGITVANPPGFQGPALLQLGQVSLRAETRSLLTSEVLIRDMQLDNMEVFVEQKGLQNNLYQVVKPLREPHPPTGRSLVIDNLEIRNVTVHVALAALPGRPQSVDLQLPAIRMTDLGRNEKMDTAALIGKILLAVTEGIARQSGGILPPETIGDLGTVLDKALDLGKIILGGQKKQ